MEYLDFVPNLNVSPHWRTNDNNKLELNVYFLDHLFERRKRKEKREKRKEKRERERRKKEKILFVKKKKFLFFSNKNDLGVDVPKYM